jgi:CDP-diacylglycerol--glycerol-3-phosphate 3-phosphatidyltransferase
VNLANRITVARVILVPFVMIFLLVPTPGWGWQMAGGWISGGSLIATIIFIVASATDTLDGYIARKRNLITNFGKFMDPLADKLLVSTALISLVAISRAPAWIVIIMIGREFAVTGLRSVASAAGTVIAASWFGKWKTVAQMVAIVLLMLNNFPFAYIHFPMDQVMLYVAALLTLLSGFDYFYKNRHAIRADE